MEDVTGMVERASGYLRGLWNGYFRGPTDDMLSCPAMLQDLFEEIEARLFGALVLRHLDRLAWLERFRREPLPFLSVVPEADPEARLLVNRRLPSFGNQYRDAFGDRLLSDEATLQFVRWFDWNFYGPHEHEYLYVRIAAFPEHPEFVGRDALIPRRSSRVLFDARVG
jgi:hypothetical protein